MFAECIAQIVIGGPARVTTLVADEDEVDKRLTATLIAGHQIVLLDNITQLKSGKIKAVLTSEIWEGRLLGRAAR